MLWSKLEGRGRDKPIFRRQYAYRSMIFDFYCPMAALAVGVDGSTHWDEDKQAKDEARDRWLGTQGISSCASEPEKSTVTLVERPMR